MAERVGPGRRLSALLAVAVAGVVLVPPATAQDGAGGDGPAQDGAPAGAEPVDLGVYGQPIRFHAPDGVVIELGSGRRLVDTVELRPSPVGDGMVVVAAMGLEEYVAGIAEMPARWPMEALKAQAVAARTYAWYQASLQTYRDRGLPYDICATTACQVFEGRSVVEAPVVGQRWQRAVDRTAGQVLLHEGDPILARYFSTSGGRTRDNEDIFPSSGAFPYLQGVEDPDDAVSPLHRWTATFTRQQFDELLSHGATLGAVTPVRDARVVQESGSTPDRVVVTGRDGTTAEVTAGELKDFLNGIAPEFFPADFPGPRSDGGTLPSTVPSSRYRIEVADEEVVLHGRGWGHAVGMGQYGAKGKAERGLDHGEILAAYYNGLTPTATPRTPDRIRVGLADDLDGLSLSADGRMEVRVGGQVVTRRAFGTWRVQGAPDGTTRLSAPGGYGAPLVVDPTTTTRTRPFAVETVQLETVVNKPAELVVDVRRGGERVGRQRVGVVEAGRHRVPWDLDTRDGPLGAGAYRVRLLAIDESGTRAGRTTRITVGAVPSGGPPPALLAGRPPGGSPVPSLPVGGVLLAAAVGLLGGVVAGRRGRARR